ncbi:MAG: hypothetical protein JO337_07575 [Acidimicrobiales bacterium]|nr:hypothetical protein [Acidimicrobiales bacterium]
MRYYREAKIVGTEPLGRCRAHERLPEAQLSRFVTVAQTGYQPGHLLHVSVIRVHMKRL